MPDSGPFLGRADEQRRWRGILEDSRRAGDDPRSFVVLLHGIGGIGKSWLVERCRRIAHGEDLPPTEPVDPPFRSVLLDLDRERDRRPDAYPPVEGPSVGTVLYTLEREVCRLVPDAADAFAPFRAALGQVVNLVADAERIRLDSERAGKTQTEEHKRGLAKAAALVGGVVGLPQAGALVDAGAAVGGSAVHLVQRRRSRRLERELGGLSEISQRRLDLAFDAERVLVDTFARGLRETFTQGGLVIAVDTAEIAVRVLPALWDVATQSGSSIVWLVAGRFEARAELGDLDSPLALFERAIGDERRAIVAVSAFDRALQRDYLRAQLGYDLDDAALAKIDRTTHGVPLGLSLVAEMLRADVPLDALDDAMAQRGRANTVTQRLAERFLSYALEAGRDALRGDLDAIFALVADETADAGRIIGWEVQRRILAALLGVEPHDLGETLRQLEQRHDFVLADSARVHAEVADVVREYMLGADLRLEHAGMHERAVAVIRGELESRSGDATLSERMDDDAWRLLAAALVRHEFWIGNERGLNALMNLVPGAAILKPDFARLLRRIASLFYPTASQDEQRVLRGLAWIRPAPEDRSDDVPPLGMPNATTDDIERARARSARRRRDALLEGSADEVAAIDELVVGDRIGDRDPHARLRHLSAADARVDEADRLFGTAIAWRAWSTAYDLVNRFARAPRSSEAALAAASLATRRAPDSEVAHWFHGVVLEELGQLDESVAAYERAVALGSNPVTYASLARALRERGDLDRAQETYERGLAADAESASVLLGYAVFLETVRRDYDRAQELYERALAADPESVFVLSSYALFVETVRRDYDRAEELYERALAADPDDSVALGFYAQFANDVRRDYDRAEELFERATARGADADTLGNYALFVEAERRDPDRAEKLYERALAADPDHANNLGNYASLVTRVRGAHDRAEELYERALAADPANGTNVWRYATFRESVLGDHDGAGRLFERAAELAPDDPRVLGGYAWFLHLVRGDLDAAERLYERALAAAPRWAELLVRYAELLLDGRGDADRAQDALERAVAAEPDNALFLGSYTRFLEDVRHDYDRVEELYERAIAADPNEAINFGNFALFMQTIRHDHERAQELYERAIALDPRFARALANYATFLYLHSGDRDRARELYERAIAADPRDASALGNYAEFVRSALGDLTRARELYERAVEADPTSASRLANYASLLEDGDRAHAEELYERALAADPEDATALAWYGTFLHTERHDRARAEELYARAIDAGAEDALTLSNYACLLLERGDRRGLDAVARAFGALPPDASGIDLELWFYLLALGPPERREESRRHVEELLEAGVRSRGWDLSRIVGRARAHGHPEPQLLERLAAAIAEDAPPSDAAA